MRQSSNYGFDIYYKDDGVAPSNRGLYFDRIINGSSTNSMFIDRSSGNLGIGTTSPDSLLNLEGVKNTSIITLGSTTNNSSWSVGDRVGGIDFYSGDGSGAGTGIKASISYEVEAGATGSTNSMVFRSAGTSAGTNNTERMRITSGGSVEFGTGAAFIPSSVDRNYLRLSSSTTASAGIAYFINPNGTVGQIATIGSSTSYLTTSDYRLKEDLKDFAGLDMVSKIPVYDFKWKTDENRSYGVMAHELQEVLPDAVSGEKDAEEMQGVDYSKIVPLLIKSIQELKQEIEILKAK